MKGLTLFGTFIATATASVVLPQGHSSSPSKRGDDSPTVTVTNGTYSGIYSQEYDQDFFLGIPYAQTPTRFSHSEHLDETWEDARDAMAWPPHCPGYGGDNVGYEQSEACLYLNVVRPAGLEQAEMEGLSVMLWIHGGGLFMGGSADRRYNMSFLVEHSLSLDTPVIGVSINYRLSAFGFLVGQEALDEGVTNIGFHDQRLAMRWVKENIASFGGNPEKITIFGESSGAESVSAQVLAYNGRDDNLFHAAIAQSGMGGAIYRYPTGLNATEGLQTTYNNLVNSTSCSEFLGTPESLPCLRSLPFAELNVSVPLAGSWAGVLDGDFIATYPSVQLEKGDFPKIPILVGSNTDEGSAFGGGSGPNTDEGFKGRVAATLYGASSADLTTEQLAAVDALSYLYPNVQSLGVPSTDSWPTIILPNTTDAETFGLQYRRTNALLGDLYFHHTRRRSNLAWSAHSVPSYAYDFNVTVAGIPGFISSTHFQEVAFVFMNLEGVGYEASPFEGMGEEYGQLARAISGAWIGFAAELDPNALAAPSLVRRDRRGGGKGGHQGGHQDGEEIAMVLPEWPVYDAAAGGGLGFNMKLQVENPHVERDDWRAGGMGWLIENSLSVFGN